MSRMKSSNYKPGGPQKRKKMSAAPRIRGGYRELSRGQKADAARYGALGQDIAEADREANRGSTQRGRAAESARLGRKRTKSSDVGRKGERSKMPSYTKRSDVGRKGERSKMPSQTKRTDVGRRGERSEVPQSMRRRPTMGAASVNPRMMDAMAQLMGRRPVDPRFDSSQAMSRRPSGIGGPMGQGRPAMGAASVNPRMMDAMSRRPMPMPRPEMGAASVNPRMMDAASRRPMPMPRPEMSRRPMPMGAASVNPRMMDAAMPMGFDPQRQAMEQMLNMQMGGRRFRSPFER